MDEREPLTEDEWKVIRARAREDKGVLEVLLFLAYPNLAIDSPEARQLTEDLRDELEAEKGS